VAFNRTTQGLIKAAVAIAQQNGQPKVSKNPRYTYERADFVAMHARYCLNKAERDEVNAILEAINAAPSMEEKGELLDTLDSRKVKPVQVKRAALNPRGKVYTGPGPKELARAEKRAKVSVTAPLAQAA
jgi:hypothetical protein